jgi:hypothetical protein
MMAVEKGEGPHNRVRTRIRKAERRLARLLVVEEIDCEPKTHRITGDTIVGLRVAFRETELRSKVKRAGGTWNRARGIWEIRYDQVVKLGLEEWIVEGGDL